jgi:hypothetical protein
MNFKHARNATRAKVVLVASSLAAVALTGTAYAYWKTTGTGTGSAATGSISLSATANVAAGKLVPGGSVAVTVNVTNPSSSKTMQVVSMPATLSVTASPNGTCGVTKLTWTPQSLPVTVAANTTTPLTGTVSMDIAVENGCQGANFAAAITVNGQLG